MNILQEYFISTGYDFDEMKGIIKQKAGLYTDTWTLKSFKDCSKKELMTAIDVSIRLGQELDVNLY